MVIMPLLFIPPPCSSGCEGMNLELTEKIDYTVDYNKGTITLTDTWGTGTLKAEYYSLWLRTNNRKLPIQNRLHQRYIYIYIYIYIKN
jgi:hypothetical protein